MAISLCPYCFNALDTQNGPCPSCGRTFVIYHWYPEAYSTKGMHATLSLSDGKKHWLPHSTDFIIGREPGNDGYPLNSPAVSRQHARVYRLDNQWHIQLLAQNMLINGDSVTETALKNGDLLQIGPYRLTASIQYDPAPIVSMTNGIFKSPESHTVILDTEQFLYVGADYQQCKIVIDGTSPKHCLIYRQKNTLDWWIADCASPSGTLLNGKRIRNEQLYDGDEIRVAGVSMHFHGSSILIGNIANNGFSLNLQHGSAKTKLNDLPILNNVSFQVQPGEFVGILGPSGCGKSSLLQRIVGLSSFDSGTLTVNGQDINSIDDVFKDNLAYIPQQISLHEDLTLAEEINAFCHLHVTDGPSPDSILKLVGLESDTRKQVGKLSGGQKRRLAIALELLRNPKLLLLDEPTSGLDPASEQSMMNYLRRVANQKRTVLCSTHIMDNVGLFDKVLILSRGYAVFYGTPDQLLSYYHVASPRELYQRLSNGDIQEQQKYARDCANRFEQLHRAESDQNSTPLPMTRRRQTVSREIRGYLYRHGLEFLSFRHAHIPLRFWQWDFWQSGIFLQLLLQPLLIAIVTKWAYAEGFCADNNGIQTNIKNLFFFCSVVVFWLGLNSAIREMVRERVPARCLERLEHISLRGYLTAKILWTGGLCLLQSVLFYTFLKIPGLSFKVLNPAYQHYHNPLSLTMLGILFLVCLTGGLFGLAISAVFRKENAAIAMLPVIMVPIFFFSHSIVNNDNDGDYVNSNSNLITVLQPRFPSSPDELLGGSKTYNPAAVYCETFNPCHTPYLLMDQLNNREQADEQDIHNFDKPVKNSWCRMLIVLGLWSLLSFGIMCSAQTMNEKAWDGR